MIFKTLADLGWSDHFRGQCEAGAVPARVSDVHRDRVVACLPERVELRLAALSAGDIAVGDWVLVENGAVQRVLERRSVVQRRAAGQEARAQLLAANVDTLMIVTSCNADFNPARLERYLALAASGGVLPLIVITKADQVADAATFRKRAERLSPEVTALTIDARDPYEVKQLHAWLRPGETAALVGSSGVGKSTLLNALTGGDAATQGIREDDAKGRHTTTARSLHAALSGGCVIDTPGMRELQLYESAEGIDAVFADLADLATNCKFSDCAHESEPGCAVQAAIAAGTLEPERLRRWQKLLREDRFNSETVAERHARDRAFGKRVKAAMKRKER
ncbi:MAG: ribosome small subunit-dependent GTPase A [Pseudomonadota bacterium]